jgi:hypothetical protein
LGRLVELGDHRLHVLADSVHYACNPVSGEFGAAVCFLNLGDGVCCLLHYAADVLHVCIWLTHCGTGRSRQLTLGTVL